MIMRINPLCNLHYYSKKSYVLLLTFEGLKYKKYMQKLMPGVPVPANLHSIILMICQIRSKFDPYS